MSETVNSFNTEAYYTNDVKVSRTNKTAVDGPASVPANHYFSDTDANKRFQSLSNDIYEGTKSKFKKKVFNIAKFNKENPKHGFDYSLFFKIFGGITLALILIACRNKIGNFFKSVK